MTYFAIDITTLITLNFSSFAGAFEGYIVSQHNMFKVYIKIDVKWSTY